MASHHPATLCGHRHCGSGDITLLLVEEQDFACPRLNLSLLFISKGHGLKVHDMSF